MLIMSTYAASLVTFLLLDGIWILGIARGFYRREMGALLRENTRYIPILLFYLSYVAVLMYLSILPAAYESDPWKVVFASALLGFASYGTYDVTNYALLKNWSLRLTVIDIMWGIFVSCISGIAGYFTYQSLV
jgi:uncharacterized membrane protein